MSDSISNKMYFIAKSINQLNNQGNVKSFSGNENGYAKLVEIKRGCSIWIHHLKNDKLIIDLMISPTSEQRYPDACKIAINKFQIYFNNQTIHDKWRHSIDDDHEYKRFYVDVTDTDETKLLEIINNLKLSFV